MSTVNLRTVQGGTLWPDHDAQLHHRCAALDHYDNWSEILSRKVLQARHELREARDRVEALLQEKATLEGRLTAMHEADAGPAAMVG